MKVSTVEISISDWKKKLSTFDNKWLSKQYRGLTHIINMIDNEIETKTTLLKNNYSGWVPDNIYMEVIYPLEDKLMDADIQLVDVEEEFERRGIEILR